MITNLPDPDLADPQFCKGYDRGYKEADKDAKIMYKQGYWAGLEEAKRMFEALHGANPNVDRQSYMLGYFDGREKESE